MIAATLLEREAELAVLESINVLAVTPAFMTALFAPALLCVALIVAGLLELGEPYAGWLIAGGALYLAGTIALTIGYHVPRNDALAAVRADDPGAERHWRRYVSEWTRMNHVRAAAALAAAAALTIAVQLEG